MAKKKKSKAARKVTSSRTPRATAKKTTKKSAKKKVTGRKPAAAKRAGKAAKKPTKRSAVKKTGAKRSGGSVSSGRKAGSKKTTRRTVTKPSAAARPTTVSAGRRRKAAEASAVPAPVKNPLTHRGTRKSRMQLLLEHQGVPVDGQVQGEHLDGSTGGSNLGMLVRATESRNESLESISEESRGKRVENLLAATANARIRGHASGAGRRTQGRRDAAQRGEKRPDMGRHAD